MADLSPRLALAASFVPVSARVCDVGTDHGYLPVFLKKNGKCEYICASEINQKPFLRAKENFRKNNLNIDLFLCDGLSEIKPGSVDTVIITGMGGEVISGIIKRASFLYNGGVSLILQPMTAADCLREFLASEGFAVKKEQAVTDSNRIYSVMLAEYTGKPYTITPAQRRIGAIKPTSQDNLTYIKRQKRLCRGLIARLEKADKKKELLETERAALAEIERLLG